MRLKESEMIEQLQREPDKFAPLIIKSIELETQLKKDFGIDAVIEFCVADGPCFKALVEFKTIATPKAISPAAYNFSFLNNMACLIRIQRSYNLEFFLKSSAVFSELFFSFSAGS